MVKYSDELSCCVPSWNEWLRTMAPLDYVKFFLLLVSIGHN